MYNYFLHVRTYLIIKRKQWAEALSRTKNNSYAPFVILCAPRSGSTLLHTYLNFHSHIRSYGEVLREYFESNNLEKNTTNLVERLVFKPHSTNCKAVGLKIFYEYYEQHPCYAACFHEVLSRKDVKIIHLIRKDILKLYVSLKIAEKTNVWSTGKSSALNNADQITIDPADYLQFRKEYLQHQKLFTSLFHDHAMFEISYEDLAQHPDVVLNDVQQFLGVKPQQLKTLLKKQNQNDVSVHVANYDEVQKLSMITY